MTLRRKTTTAAQVKQPDLEGDGDGPMTMLVSTDAMDGEGDVVEQSWEFDDQIPFLWVHNRHGDALLKMPIGHVVNPRVVDVRSLDVTVSDDAERALVVDVDFDPDDDFAQAVRRKYQRGDLQDSSVGFDPIDVEEFGADEPGRLHFLRSRLKEVSATPIGANQDTRPLTKDFDPDVIPDQLQELIGEPDCAKDGQRNNKRDASAMRHAKEMLEFTTGEIAEEDIGDCPFHKGSDDMDDSKDGDVTQTKDGAYRIRMKCGEVEVDVSAPTAQEVKQLAEDARADLGDGEKDGDGGGDDESLTVEVDGQEFEVAE